ncbi:DNA-binding protein [Nostoc ellipsosporum NOK]|nr:DNA-binding protein [Nostoc ellipsosporum NOK]
MRLLVTILLLTVTLTASAQQRYTKTPTGYLMVLRQGDSILQHLEKFAMDENIPSANFTGMGFVNVTFGFFDAKTKQYNPKEFRDVEMSGMLGSIAWQKGKPSIHTHGVVTGRDFVAYGGHILSCTVGTGSLEIAITVHNKRLERERDEQLGANVLSIE